MEHQLTKREMHSHKKRNIKRRHHNPLFQHRALTLQAPMFKEPKRGSQRGCREGVFTLRQQLKWIILALRSYSDWAPLTRHFTNVQKERQYLQTELHLNPGELIWGLTLWSGLITQLCSMREILVQFTRGHQREMMNRHQERLFWQKRKKRC